MKCTACGLPLSPSRTNASCPRCGTLVSAGVGAPAQDRQWGQAASSAAFQPSMTQAPMPQPGQMWAAGSNGTQGSGPQIPMRPVPNRPPRNSRLGFMIAGMCVLIGGILLVLVYFMAMGQPGNTSTTSTTPTSTHAVSSLAVTPTPASSPSPTATSYPGQQYINNGQMSSVQPSPSQPAQPTSTFKVNQTLYVVFNINSGGQTGAVCLIWYLNGKPIFNFAFAIGAHTTASYAYFSYGTPGSAYVELYWASNKSCTGQVLAQHVGFTITP